MRLKPAVVLWAAFSAAFSQHLSPRYPVPCDVFCNIGTPVARPALSRHTSLSAILSVSCLYLMLNFFCPNFLAATYRKENFLELNRELGKTGVLLM